MHNGNQSNPANLDATDQCVIPSNISLVNSKKVVEIIKICRIRHQEMSIDVDEIYSDYSIF